MFRTRTPVQVFCLTGLALVANGIGGCAVLQKRVDTPPPRGGISAEIPAAQSSLESSTSSREAVLTAVQEFLERTKTYEIDQGPGQRASLNAEAPRIADSRAAAPAPPAADASSRSLRRDQPPADAQAYANTQLTLANPPPGNPLPAPPVVQTVSVRAVRSEAPSSDLPIRASITNEPLETAKNAPMSLADRLIEQLQGRAREAADFESEWQLRLAQLAFHRDAETADVSPGLPQEAKRLMSTLVDAILAVRRAALDPGLVSEEPLRQVDELRQVLSERADLAISTVALCRKVVAFGLYEEMKPEEFVPGRPVPVIVYSEIRNFRSEQQSDGAYLTRLSTRMELLSSDGQSLWRHTEPDILDSCRRRRNDFFIAQRITLPATLPVGPCVLKVLVEDKLSGKACEQSHTFVAGAAAGVARLP